MNGSHAVPQLPCLARADGGVQDCVCSTLCTWQHVHDHLPKPQQWLLQLKAITQACITVTLVQLIGQAYAY